MNRLNATSLVAALCGLIGMAVFVSLVPLDNLPAHGRPFVSGDLRECAHCGSEGRHLVRLAVLGAPLAVEAVQCSFCPAQMRVKPGGTDIKAAWNMRTSDVLLREMREIIVQQLALFESAEIETSTERGLLRRVAEELGEEP